MSERYELIDAEKDTVIESSERKYTVTQMCAWLKVSTSGYYEWRCRPASATAERRARLADAVGRIFVDSDETYGHRRIHAQLAREGERATPELVRAVMRDLGLVPCQPRPWRHSLTDGDAAAPLPDLVRRDFTAARPGRKLVGDVTYIPTWEGWAYLATVIDCCTKEVVGWGSTTTTRPRWWRTRSGWQHATTTLPPGRSSTRTEAATICRLSSLRLWSRLISGNRSDVPAYVTTTR